MLATGAGITRRYSVALKTAISLPDDTFRRAERAARRMGMSRSEFFARAAERWLADLEDDPTTEAIDRAIAGVGDETAFTDAAAAALVSAHDQVWSLAAMCGGRTSTCREAQLQRCDSRC
jgi:hypothetical protein